jgi:hypothetical protein
MKNKINTMASAADDLSKALATFGTPILGRINQSFIGFNDACEKIKKLKEIKTKK